MKIFIDSADIEEIKKSFEWGIIDGVTTNPSLIKKANPKNTNLKKSLKNILIAANNTPISLEVTSRKSEDMIKEGKIIYKKFRRYNKNLNIKIPINTSFSKNDKNQFEGIKAIKALSKKNIPINCTLIFTPEQALLAAKAGATYVSPFLGRIDDLLRKNKKFDKHSYFPKTGISKKNDNGIVSGIDLVEKIVHIFHNYDINTKVLAASLRNPRQVRETALAGADIATLPFSVIQEMLKHEKTYQGMKNFTKDIIPEYASLTK